MAIGDEAAAAGLAKYASSQDRRLGWENDNQRGDEIARVMGRTAALEALQVRHAEFTTQRTATPDGGPRGAGGVTRVNAGTTDPSIATPIDNTLEANGIRLVAGVYAITWNVVTRGQAGTGRGFLQIVDAASGTVYIRVPIPQGEDQTGVSLANLNVTAPKNILLQFFKTTGGSTTVDGQLYITKWR